LALRVVLRLVQWLETLVPAQLWELLRVVSVAALTRDWMPITSTSVHLSTACASVVIA
jgi:hypothetical protein